MKTNLQISLTLTGLILFIIISIPAEAQFNWYKCENNPVIEGTSGTWIQNILYPSVFFNDDLFEMWYCAWEGETRQIGYAFSIDGRDWYVDFEPAIPGGSSGDWNIHKYPGTVLLIDDTLRMWYFGSTNSADNFSIGYAWAVETNEWNLSPQPVLEKGEEGSWDDMGVLKHSVYFDESVSTYHMYYTGMKTEDPQMRIGHATSPDGMNWTKDEAHNPVLTPGAGGTFYDSWIAAHGLVFYNDTLRMFYEGYTGSGNPFDGYLKVGYAWSTDFSTWNIESVLWPVLDVGGQGSWDELWAGNPSVLVHNDSLKMWYTGNSPGTILKIGCAIGDLVDTGVGYTDHSTPMPELFSALPNPFKDQLTFSCQLKDKSQLHIDLFNCNGQQISSVASVVMEAGSHEILFDGSKLPAGMYFCVLQTHQSTITKKIIKLY